MDKNSQKSLFYGDVLTKAINISIMPEIKKWQEDSLLRANTYCYTDSSKSIQNPEYMGKSLERISQLAVI